MSDTGDSILLTENPLEVADALAFLRDQRAGGIDLFLGVTRAEKNPAGQDLLALDYEAYGEMAIRQMRDLAARARAQFPVLGIVLWHRLGRVIVADPSVLIAVACPHRGEAFAACRFLIDTLKAEIAIWKKEVWADGSNTWVDPGSV